MRKSTITYLAITLFIWSCESKKTESTQSSELSKEEVQVLEKEVSAVDSLTKEMTQSAQDLEEALKELEN